MVGGLGRKIKQAKNTLKEGYDAAKGIKDLKAKAETQIFEEKNADGTIVANVNGLGTLVGLTIAQPQIDTDKLSEDLMGVVNRAKTRADNWIKVQKLPFFKKLPVDKMGLADL